MFIKYTKSIKYFISKVFKFFLPIIFVIFIFEFMAIYSGELIPIEYVVKFQNNSSLDSYYGRKIIDQEFYKYKYFSFLAKKPDILVVGSSRVMQIREGIFDPYYSFYNAGGIIQSLSDLNDLEILLENNYKPKYIILGLDIWWFGQKAELESGLNEGIIEKDSAYNWKSHLAVYKYLIKLLFNPNELFAIFNNQLLDNSLGYYGFQALEGNGFRNDGSFIYENYNKEMEVNDAYVDRETPPIIDRLKNGSKQFVFDNDFDKLKLSILDKFLKFCKNNDIKVIGMAPPFSTEVYKELNYSINYKNLLIPYQEDLPKVFSNYGFYFFDASDITKLGLNDKYMYDGIHGTETALAKIFKIIFSSEIIENYFENNDLLKNLQESIDNSMSNYYMIDW